MVQPGDFKPLKALIQFWVVQENHHEQFEGLMKTPVNEVHQGASLNGEGPNLQRPPKCYILVMICLVGWC